MNQSNKYPVCCQDCVYVDNLPKDNPCNICKWDKYSRKATEFKKK